MTKKINDATEQFIFEQLAKGLTYKEIVSAVRREKGINISIMAISHLKERIKKYITSDFEKELAKEQRMDLDLKRSSLNRCLEISLDLSERYLLRLKEKDDKYGLDPKDIRVLNEITDRLIKLRSILSAALVLSKELSFPAQAIKLREKYRLEKKIPT